MDHLYHAAAPLPEDSDKDLHLKSTNQGACKEYLQSCLPRFLLCCCCRKRRRDRFFVEAREKLSEDLDVVKILRRMRFMEKSLSFLMPPEAMAEIQDKTKF